AESELNHDIRGYLNEINIPFVGIDRAVFSEKYHSVTVNNLEGALMAANHLVEIGCKKIAHISGPQTLYPAIERMNGYK
ncbi:substrate-binding domain-containing protein, partial [Escherichia coli]|nr:substrate-binding domain-containing protein [Escherichia coli]